jgi:hypothetical protein
MLKRNPEEVPKFLPSGRKRKEKTQRTAQIAAQLHRNKKTERYTER